MTDRLPKASRAIAGADDGFEPDIALSPDEVRVSRVCGVELG